MSLLSETGFRFGLAFVEGFVLVYRFRLIALLSGTKDLVSAEAADFLSADELGRQVICTSFLECTVPYFGSGSLFPYPDPPVTPQSGNYRLFGAAELWVDCAGTPLGSARLDYCNKCGGDNSTCSGCDGVPNRVEDGLKLDKNCSGHGACRSQLPSWLCFFLLHSACRRISDLRKCLHVRSE